MGRRRRAEDETPREAVERILADPRVAWLPVRHHSPACALHVGRWIREHRPPAVLVEGPEEASELIRWVVDPAAEPPLAVLTTYVDAKNTLGGNGVLSPSPEVPARYRAWWPLVGHGPEWAALRAGAEVGAELRFVDAPHRAVLALAGAAASDVPDDRALAESRYFRTLAERTRRLGFDGFWDGTFEAGAVEVSSEDFFRAVLLFAWCARHVGGDERSLEADGTLLREAHMRWHVDQALKAHPEGRIAVVTGAFHAVALPTTKGRRARAKDDRNAQTLLYATSGRALARVGAVPHHRWGEEVHRAMLQGERDPCDVATLRLVVEITDAARARGVPVGTADAVGATVVARGLARLRGSAEPTVQDLLDGVRAALVKGEVDGAGAPVLAAAAEVLVGRRLGVLPPTAGRPPLVEDWHAEARHHRLDLSGEVKEVRCDLHKQERHRDKSAFFHRCALLEIPMFGELERANGAAPHFRGPDPIEGTDLHLSTETWAFRWSEDVEDRLLELSDRGTTIAEAAASVLGEQRAAAGEDVTARARVVLRAAQTRLVEILPDLLEDLATALARDPAFDHLVEALEDLVLLHGYRDAWPTRGDARVGEIVGTAFTRACLALPSAGSVADEEAVATVERLQSLLSVALGQALPGGARPDRALLVEQLRVLVADRAAQPLVRGAAYGLLSALGAAREAQVAAELRAYLQGPLEQVLRGGAFLEGVLRASRSAFLRGPRLLAAVDEVLARLDDDAFLRILPDLRRAFSVFVPAEIETLGERVAERLALKEPPDPDAPIPEDLVALASAVDHRVAERITAWLPP